MNTQLQSIHPVLFTLIFSLTLWLAPMVAKAQVSININLQPAWGPVEYDYVEYYYLPEYEVYYDVPRHQFVYFDGGRWLFGVSLPARYGVINYYSTYKVVINEPRAYRGFHHHRTQYAQYKHGGHQQHMIRDSHSPKYSKHQRVSNGGRNERPQGNQPQSRPRSNSPQGNSNGNGNQQKGGGHGGRKH
ncbi:MAG: hypothetical protein V4651_00660 [Bacteroidota bacterium]